MRHAPHNIVEHTHTKILVSALECQVSWGDTYGEVVDHSCNWHTPQNRVGNTIVHVTLNSVLVH